MAQRVGFPPHSTTLSSSIICGNSAHVLSVSSGVSSGFFARGLPNSQKRVSGKAMLNCPRYKWERVCAQWSVIDRHPIQTCNAQSLLTRSHMPKHRLVSANGLGQVVLVNQIVLDKTLGDIWTHKTIGWDIDAPLSHMVLSPAVDTRINQEYTCVVYTIV